jgi:hypothetical protein
MKKLLMTILVLVVIVITGGGLFLWNKANKIMASLEVEREILKGECYNTENIQVEIGGNVYQIPRKAVSSIMVTNPKDNKHNLGNGEICYTNDLPIKAESIDFLFENLNSCISNSRCKPDSLVLRYSENSELYQEIRNLNKSDLMKRFCRIKTHTNRLKCDFVPIEKMLGVDFQVYLDSYPVENIDKTIDSIIEKINSYKINKTL